MPALAQVGSTRIELTPVAEVMWGELVARDAMTRAAGIAPHVADHKEATPPRPNDLRMRADGAVELVPLDMTKPIPGANQLAAGASSLGSLSYAAQGATPRAGGSELANLLTQQSFLGLRDSNASIPPDTMGTIGANHLVTMLNTQTAIHNRTGGTLSIVTTNTFFSPIGSGVFDPRIFYDELSNRWVALTVNGAGAASSAVLIAVSATSDPTGLWRFFSIDTDAANVDWADFPQLGYNNRWIAITANMFSIAAGQFSGAKMWVLEKTSAYSSGSPLVIHTFATGFDLAGGVSSFSLAPAHTHDAAENLLYIADFPGTSGGTPFVRFSRILGSTTAPAWSPLANPAPLPFPNSGVYQSPVSFNATFPNAAQLGSANRISTNGPRMQDAEFRNGSLWCTQMGGLPTSAADRTIVVWYEINPTAVAAPFVQSGAVAGGADEHYFFPSIAVNREDDMVLGFSHSSPTIFAEAGHAGRLAIDPLGTTRAPVTYKVGEAKYFKTFSGTSNRWGDYSQTSVDPKDGRSFWALQEYASLPVSGFDRWATQWARVGFVSCPIEYDGDGSIGPGDLLTLLSSFGVFFGPSDLLDLLANFGATCPTQIP